MDLPKDFFFIVVSLKSLCNELESITFNGNKITVIIKIKGQKLRTQRFEKTFELKDYLNKLELIDNITKKENEIKQLRNILEISNFGFLTKIPISTKQVFNDRSNYINNTENSLLNQELQVWSSDFYENDENSSPRQERKYGASVNFTEIPISTKQAFHDCSNYINHAEDFSLNQELQNKRHSSILCQILNEFKGKDPEDIWIDINSKLERIFGYQKLLESPDEELRIDYLKLILELQNCEVLKQFKEPIKLWKAKAESTFGPFNSVLLSEQSETSPNKNDDGVYSTQTKWQKVADTLKEKINNTPNNYIFEDNIDTTSISSLEDIKEELISWRKIDLNIKKNEKIEKLEHFFKLKKLYFKLWQVATQQTPSDFKSLNPTKKALNDIPFGKNPPPKIVRGWISKIISSSFDITDKTERKIWSLLNILDALRSNITFESLIEADATLNFFNKMNKPDLKSFYQHVTQNKQIKYQPFLPI
ncbi:45534_t:CDS:2, partial [Gigaspora margarita]